MNRQDVMKVLLEQFPEAKNEKLQAVGDLIVTRAARGQRHGGRENQKASKCFEVWIGSGPPVIVYSKADVRHVIRQKEFGASHEVRDEEGNLLPEFLPL